MNHQSAEYYAHQIEKVAASAGDDPETDHLKLDDAMMNLIHALSPEHGKRVREAIKDMRLWYA